MPDKQKHNHIPALRFPDFANDGEWEVKRLGEIAELYAGATPSTTVLEYWEGGTIPWMSSGEVHNGQIFQTEKKITKLGYDNCSTKLVPTNSVVVALAGQGKTRGTVAITRIQLCTNQSLCSIIPNPTYCSDYLYFYLGSQYEVLRQISSGDGTRGGLNLQMLKDFLIPFPPLAEQKRIAACLSAADEMIAYTNGKLEQLKAYKKGLMQNLFPAKGKKLPKLRFKEFEKDGEWVEKKLGEVGEFYKGKGIPKTEATDKGETPCVRYGELYTHYNEVIEEIQSFTDIPIDELFLSKANDVIIPSSGETKEDISTASCVLKDNVALGGDINVVRTTQNGVFLSYYLNNAKKDDIAKIAQGVSIIHLYNDQLKNLKINIPSLPEQRKIASCLSTMDDQINAYTEKVALLGQYKKGLMQRVFP